MLVPALLALFTSWQSAFATPHTHRRAVRHALALIAVLGRGTVTALLRTLGQTGANWLKEYRFYTDPLGARRPLRYAARGGAALVS